MACPEIEEIERHLSGGLDEAGRRRLAEHLGTCHSCAGRLEEVSDNLAAFSSLQDVLRRDGAAADARPPERIGAFAIIREIGRGGMGVIYLAEQERPSRQVALKVLRGGMTSADALRRFEREAEFLARLTHPGIATVYEAGVTTVSTGAAPERVPYIAMEYIAGQRLDRYAEAARLSVEQRLELMARIADAVHHAHANGLVHRDLKPGNILVVPGEGKDPGQPKVLDFGIARLGEADAGGTLRTSTGQLLGTVPYMSPEQLAGQPSAVAARSDIYSLGVMAFELLTGELPHDVRNLPIAEAARVIRDEPPGSLGGQRPELRGDVETLVGKMLEKEPGRRYASAAEVAEDIRRFLHREPIRARPPSSWYQLTRFAQRNRALTASLVLLFLVLAGAALVSGTLAVRAMRAELRAQEQLAEAKRQAERFEAVNRFLEEMLAAPSPEDNPGQPDVTVREALAAGAARLDSGSLSAQPDIELGVRTAIGDSYRALGEYAAAREQLERAVELGRAVHPECHEDLAYALNKLGRVLARTGDFENAEASFTESLEMRRRLVGPSSQEIASTLNNLAQLLSDQSRYEEAIERHQEALAMRRELLGPAHEDIASSLNNIAVAHYFLGNLELAEPMYRESLSMDREIRGELHPNVAATMNNLAVLLSQMGRRDEAESLQRRALALEREIYGAGNPRLANSLLNLARLLVDTDRLDEAQPLFAEALELERSARGDRHPAVANILGNQAALHEKRGEVARAEDMHRQALDIRRETLGDDAMPTLGSRYHLARIAAESGRLAAAAEAYAALVADARRALPPNSRYLFIMLSGYGLCLRDLERHQEAAGVLREAQQVGSAAVPEDDPRLTRVAEALAGLGDR